MTKRDRDERARESPPSRTSSRWIASGRRHTRERAQSHKKRSPRALRVIYCYYVFRVQKLVYLFIYFSRCLACVCVCVELLCNSHAGERPAMVDTGHAHANAQYLYADSHSTVRCTCQLIPLRIHRVGICAITPGPFKGTVCSSAAVANKCLCAPWLKRPAHSTRR